jgi:hypothetical protein
VHRGDLCHDRINTVGHDIDNGDSRAFIGEQVGGGATDSAPGSGDDGDTTGD